MTVDEFLPWAEGQERGRYELHDGEVIAMAPQRAAHWEVKLNAAVALRGAISAAALNCHAVPDGATVRISARTAFEPDALVYCGDKVAGDSLEVPNPVIVVEVLSPGTQMIDMRDTCWRSGYLSASCSAISPCPACSITSSWTRKSRWSFTMRAGMAMCCKPGC